MSSFAHGQTNFGIYVGSVTNKFEGDDVSKLTDLRFSIKSTITTGVVIDIPVASDVYITIIPGYKTIAGTTYKSNPLYEVQVNLGLSPTAPRYKDISDIKLQYIALPVLLKVISNNERWQFMAGIESAWSFSSKLTDLEIDSKIEIGQHIRDINVSAIFGFGYRFNLLKQKFAFDLMYTQGLLNVSSGYQLDVASVPRVKTTTGESRLTWYLPLKSAKKQ
ncbi:PorT family protein [Reichenbachiella carrageenanivorans]|uniref:PorT family protein n=1 Tax=Reichenbachiella carrageenanivorans TaxID=2979869 RepID=A0ABY6D0E6_9BACT|nr:PorT family protein [Reichenbachiella carrageenanivorans]UXX79617.1 PorT family protein [Reichenbachiella carrageenanivorans]